MPEFGRLDYMTRAGWVVGHAGVALQDPPRYLAALGRRDVVARFVPGGPGGPEAYGTPVLPPAAPDFPHAPQGKVPMTRVVECAACGQPHRVVWECLL